MVWFNGVPGAVLAVAFDSPPAAIEDCTATAPVPGPSRSELLSPGEGRILCFLRPGRYPFHAVVATPRAAVMLRGVVTVLED